MLYLERAWQQGSLCSHPSESPTSNMIVSTVTFILTEGGVKVTKSKNIPSLFQRCLWLVLWQGFQ